MESPNIRLFCEFAKMSGKIKRIFEKTLKLSNILDKNHLILSNIFEKMQKILIF